MAEYAAVLDAKVIISTEITNLLYSNVFSFGKLFSLTSLFNYLNHC